MANLFYGLNIGKNTLRSQSDVININAHNIANANTPGFSRQRVELAAVSDMSRSGKMTGTVLKIGSGVESKTITRSRFALFDEIYRDENLKLNFNQKTEELVHQIELYFDEPSDRGIGSIIDDFFNGWLDLSNDPQNIAARQSLYSTANEMAERMKRIYNALITMREDIDAEISAIPEQINEINAGIAELNLSIIKSENVGGTANDLRDKRDLLIDELSGYAKVKAVEHDNGSTTIIIGNQVVVERERYTVLSTVSSVDENLGLTQTKIVSEEGVEYIPDQGKLGALVNLRDNILINLMGDLNTLAEAIVTTINFDHRLGYGLDGLQNRDFFNPSNLKAYNIELSRDIEDITNIAVSIDGSKGDNTNALNINELKNKRVIDNQFTIKNFYNGMVTNLGVLAREAKSSRVNQELLTTQINNSREGIKGVNIDEELISIMMAQRIYQSASRMIVVMDELLEEVVNLV